MHDEGKATLRLPATHATIEQKLAGLAPARGMGLLLMQQLVDEVDVMAAERGAGNAVRLRQYRSTPHTRAA